MGLINEAHELFDALLSRVASGMGDDERRPSVDVFVNGYPPLGLRLVGIVWVGRADVDEGCADADLLATDAADPDASPITGISTDLARCRPEVDSPQAITERGDRGIWPVRCSRQRAVRGRLPLERADTIETSDRGPDGPALSS